MTNLPLGHNKKIENLLLFKAMFEQMVIAEGSEIKHLAIQQWASRNKSTMDCLLYAIESVINRHIYEEENKRTDEI